MNVRAIIHRVYKEQQSVPFVWGVSDCITFCAAVALEMKHVDVIAHLRGQWWDDASAKQGMVDRGWSSIGDVAASIFPEIHVSQAQSGDWAFIINTDGTETLGVVVGGEIACRAKSGMGLVPLLRASRAFKVS